MVKFTDENKQVSGFNDNFFKYGVHLVHIGLIELGKTDDGKEFVEVTVIGDNDEEDKARIWFTTDAAINYSFNVLRQIYVHNAPDAKKDEARNTIDGAADTEHLVELMQKCLTKECWFSVYPSPNRTYTNQAGEVKKSIDKNVYGYEPKAKPELIPAKDGGSVQIEDLTAGAVPADKATTDLIPKDW